jgi:hypothetical protein
MGQAAAADDAFGAFDAAGRFDLEAVGVVEGGRVDEGS